MKGLLTSTRIVCLFTVLLALLTSIPASFAQSKKTDTIVKKDNTTIRCQILDVGSTVIRYRGMKGPNTLLIKKTLVSRIVYANGLVRIISPAPNVPKPSVSEPEMPMQNSDKKSVKENSRAEVNRESDLDEIIQDIEQGKLVKDRTIRLHTILFETGSNKVQSESFAYLDSIALFLVRIPTVTVEVSGYTDNTGNASANLLLSKSRANAVRGHLVNIKKIASSRIQAAGYGQTAPIATNNNEQGRALNRRVELKFLGLSNEVYTIQLKDGRRIPVTFVVSSADNRNISYRENANAPLVKMLVDSVDFIEYPDGSRRRIGSTDVINTSRDDTGNRNGTTMRERSKFSIQLNGLPAYMLGSAVWTSLPNGYGHTIGGGGSAQFDYWLTRRISVGAELGYLAWSTQVDIVESPGQTPYYTYRTKTSQTFAMAHVRVKLGDHFYLMPQGGISQVQVTVENATSRNSSSDTQMNYGGALGYLAPLGRRFNLDAGLFYRTAIGSKTPETSSGTEPAQYVGVRLGLGFSH